MRNLLLALITTLAMVAGSTLSAFADSGSISP